MFGYVVPTTLPDTEWKRFRCAYCGLCHTLGERYGTAARMILNYDFTFLAILLSDGGARDKHNGDDFDALTRLSRCPAHPLRKRQYLSAAPALELAADESVILAWRQFGDGIRDNGKRFAAIKYRAAAGILRRAYEKAAARRPAFDALTVTQLSKLSELERQRCPSIDRAADTFAVLLTGAAGFEMDKTRRRVLEQIFYHLGRWIYLIDAADDLKRDAASGDYNPVALRYNLTDGVWTEQARREFAATLDHSIHAMAAAFELWDFGVWSAILEHTLYVSLFQVGKAVLDGTWRNAKKIRRRGNEENT